MVEPDSRVLCVCTNVCMVLMTRLLVRIRNQEERAASERMVMVQREQQQQREREMQRQQQLQQQHFRQSAGRECSWVCSCRWQEGLRFQDRNCLVCLIDDVHVEKRGICRVVFVPVQVAGRTVCAGSS